MASIYEINVAGETVVRDETPEEEAVRDAGESMVPGADGVDRPSIQYQLTAIFSQLTPEEQAAFATLAAAVELQLKYNQPLVAKIIIQNATIPADLEPVRQGMLAVFQEE